MSDEYYIVFIIGVTFLQDGVCSYWDGVSLKAAVSLDGAGAALSGHRLPATNYWEKVETKHIHLLVVWRGGLQILATELGAITRADARVSAEEELSPQHDFWIICLYVITIFAVFGEDRIPAVLRHIRFVAQAFTLVHLDQSRADGVGVVIGDTVSSPGSFFSSV